jgi:hypothetical protein
MACAALAAPKTPDSPKGLQKLIDQARDAPVNER